MSARVVAVAASGGRDSTALLHATVRAARGAGLRVVALHVHHGLNANAEGWQAHVQRQCARWARAGWPVACLTRRLAGAPRAGESVEAWARNGRYAALAEMAAEAGATLVLLAHHRRDQAETLLLQALRGSGPAGLAAMPGAAQRRGLTWARPWLDMPADAIAAYVARHRLTHIDDDSNADTRYDRNRLRHAVWPALVAAFPHAEATLAQAARQVQRAAALVDEVARADLAVLAQEKEPSPALRVAAWRALSPARQHAALRLWLHAQAPEGARDALLQRLLAELPAASAARWPLSPTHELRLYRGRLTAEPLKPTAAQRRAARQRLDRPGWLELPGGRLQIAPATQGGIALAVLAAATLRARAPGDDFQFAPRSTARSLKKQYQARAVPAWAREAPLVALGGRVLFVPGLGTDARALAPAGEPQLRLHWWPAASQA